MATAKPTPLPPRPKPPGRALPRRRRWRTALIVCALALAGALFAYRTEIMGRAEAGAAYGARVTCSCRYFGGRSLEDCRKDFVAGMSLIMLSEDKEAKAITARLPLLARHTARMRPGAGCVLDTWED